MYILIFLEYSLKIGRRILPLTIHPFTLFRSVLFNFYKQELTNASNPSSFYLPVYILSNLYMKELTSTSSPSSLLLYVSFYAQKTLSKKSTRVFIIFYLFHYPLGSVFPLIPHLIQFGFDVFSFYQTPWRPKKRVKVLVKGKGRAEEKWEEEEETMRRLKV